MHRVIDCYSKEKCTGCAACYNVCPRMAIEMKQDIRGFLYPVFDAERCIHCSACKQVCQIGKNSLHENDKRRYFGGKAKDSNEQITSTSGGVFSVLARHIIRKNGSVYGVAYNNKFEAVHVKVIDEVGLDSLKGSKYLQSEISLCYKSILGDLKDNKRVLFSGTACQVAGLMNYLRLCKVDMSKLYTCDIVCHGVPSPGMFSDYIDYLEEKHNSSVVKYVFRDKENYAWGKGRELVVFQNGDVINKPDPWGLDFYMMAYRHELIRPACHQCEFANLNRPGDLTTGDFWGLEKDYAEQYDSKGVSLVIVNTEQGKRLLDAVYDEVTLFEVKKESCLQPNLCKPSMKKEETDKFWKCYETGGYKALVKLDKPSLLKKVKLNMKKGLRQLFS